MTLNPYSPPPTAPGDGYSSRVWQPQTGWAYCVIETLFVWGALSLAGKAIVEVLTPDSLGRVALMTLFFSAFCFCWIHWRFGIGRVKQIVG